MTKTKKLMALLLVVAMLFTFVSVIAACKPQDECEKNGHKLTAVAKKDATLQEAGYEAYWKCDVCGKLFSDSEGKNEISKPVVIDKLTPHVCGHVCPTCGKCLDATCTDPACAEKCAGHEVAPSKEGVFTPITQPVAGQYYMGMKCSGDVYYYLKGGMANFYMATSNNKEDAVVVTLVEDGDGWLLKQGEKYMEIEISGTHVNAVYKDAQTAGKHWSWDETYKIFTWENGTYFYGTYGTYNTVGGGTYQTHAASNYKAQLGLFVQPETPTAVELSKTGTIRLLPANTYKLTATVTPAEASQDVDWSTSDAEKVTVTNGLVRAVAQGTVTITAKAKGTNVSATVTVEVLDNTQKGYTQNNPLSVDDAIVLMDQAGDGVEVFADDSGAGYYITGVVDEGSTITGVWQFTMSGSSKQISFTTTTSPTALGKEFADMKNGMLDGCMVVVQATFKLDGENYAVVYDSQTSRFVMIVSCVYPALTGITITGDNEVLEGFVIYLKAVPVPANAPFEGVEWHSSQEGKATVDDGKVMGIEEGTTEITVSCGNITSDPFTVTVNALSENVAIYDWTGPYVGQEISTDNFYDTTGDLVNDYINVWTPGQLEIKTFTVTGFTATFTDSIPWYPGIAYDGYFATAPGEMVFTTEHAIKKITLKIVATQYANSIQLTVNGTEFKQEKGSNTWNGQLGSASEYNPEFDLSAAPTNTITITAPQSEDLSYVIVGITLEW